MKTLVFAAICNGGAVLFLLSLSWLAYRGCDTFGLVIYLALAALNLGVLAIQWVAFQIKRNNDKRAAEQQAAFDATLKDLVDVTNALREAE